MAHVTGPGEHPGSDPIGRRAARRANAGVDREVGASGDKSGEKSGAASGAERDADVAAKNAKVMVPGRHLDAGIEPVVNAAVMNAVKPVLFDTSGIFGLRHVRELAVGGLSEAVRAAVAPQVLPSQVMA